MILRLLFTLLLGLSASESWAAMCDVRTSTPTFTDLTAMGLLSCDTSGNLRMTLNTLLSGEDQTNNLLMTSGGAVRQTTVESQITDTTSAAVTVPVGSKTFMGVLTGAGAIAQTMKLYGAFSSTASNGVLLCTLTLTGTTATSDACPVVTANFSYYYVVTTASSGLTTAVMYAMY